MHSVSKHVRRGAVIYLFFSFTFSLFFTNDSLDLS